MQEPAIRYDPLLSLITNHVRRLFSEYQNPNLTYHNLSHTENVVENVTEIPSVYKLSELDLFIIKAAAWFHDCGHLFGPAKDHEIKSVQIMKEKLEPTGLDEQIISSIEQCISATKITTVPVSLNEKILCDADLFHLGTEQFTHINNLVKQEFKLRKTYLPEDWDERTFRFLNNHSFYTSFCQVLLTPGKQKNIAYVEQLIAGKTDFLR